jgi:hypothetical protein
MVSLFGFFVFFSKEISERIAGCCERDSKSVENP